MDLVCASRIIRHWSELKVSKYYLLKMRILFFFKYHNGGVDLIWSSFVEKLIFLSKGTPFVFRAVFPVFFSKGGRYLEAIEFSFLQKVLFLCVEHTLSVRLTWIWFLSLTIRAISLKNTICFKYFLSFCYFLPLIHTRVWGQPPPPPKLLRFITAYFTLKLFIQKHIIMHWPQFWWSPSENLELVGIKEKFLQNMRTIFDWFLYIFSLYYKIHDVQNWPRYISLK